MMQKCLFFLFIFIANCFNAHAQSNAEKAMDKMIEAIKLIDENKTDDAIAVLKEAQTLDQKNIDITYEIAHCYYTKGEYKTAIPYLEKIIKTSSALDHVYQLLGNSYANEFNHQQALATYKTGIAKFPNSGPLHAEIGIYFLANKQLNKALNYFEHGIKVDPLFAANYYHAAKLFAASDNKIWGIIYGELFMNMERNSLRTQEISKLLFNTYQQAIIYKNATFIGTDFSNPKSKQGDSSFNGTLKKDNFVQQIVEPNITSICKEYTSINLQNLHAIRNQFLKNIASQTTKGASNILFSYQQQMKDASVFEAYNYWLFNKGDETAFKAWASGNKADFNFFLKWYQQHPILMDDTHTLHRLDYSK
jgi:hypothetical protein